MALYENLDDNALIVNDTQTMEALRQEKKLQGIEVSYVFGFLFLFSSSVSTNWLFFMIFSCV